MICLIVTIQEKSSQGHSKWKLGHYDLLLLLIHYILQYVNNKAHYKFGHHGKCDSVDYILPL